VFKKNLKKEKKRKEKIKGEKEKEVENISAQSDSDGTRDRSRFSQYASRRVEADWSFSRAFFVFCFSVLFFDIVPAFLCMFGGRFGV
jgi:hypothetical protein